MSTNSNSGTILKVMSHDFTKEELEGLWNKHDKGEIQKWNYFETQLS